MKRAILSVLAGVLLIPAAFAGHPFTVTLSQVTTGTALFVSSEPVEMPNWDGDWQITALWANLPDFTSTPTLTLRVGALPAGTTISASTAFYFQSSAMADNTDTQVINPTTAGHRIPLSTNISKPTYIWGVLSATEATDVDVVLTGIISDK